MNEAIKEFFDRFASSWDEHADDDPNLIEHFIDLLDLTKDSSVLDLACGTGVLTPFLLKRDPASILGLDLSSEMILKASGKYNHPKLRYESGDFCAYSGKVFDAIVCYNAYPHFLDRDAFAAKAHELLRQGGRLLICHNAGRDRINAHHQHCMDVSRCLLEIHEEALYFPANQFACVKAEESNNHYLLLLKRI